MSTLKATNLQNENSASVNISLDTAGNVAVGASLGIGATPVNPLTIGGNGVTLTAGYATYLVNGYYDGAWKYVGNAFAWGIGNNFGGTADHATIATAAVNASGAGAALTWSPRISVGASSTIHGQTGFAVTPHNLGTGSGTITPSPYLGNYQYITNNGAFTMAAPTVDCAIDLLVTNGASAGAITISGYTAPSGGGGDTYATTNAQKYLFMIRRINGTSTYAWKALQ